MSAARATWEVARLAAAGSMLLPPLAPLLLAAAAIDAYGARSTPTTGRTFDALVVAGCKVGNDGAPSAALIRRCALASRLYADGAAPLIVVTGGSIRGRPAEADVAAALLEGVVPGPVVVRERKSRRTEENAAGAAALIGNDASVLVVTDSFHALRCRRVFARHFRRVDVVGALGPAAPRLRAAMREVLAISSEVASAGEISKFALKFRI